MTENRLDSDSQMKGTEMSNQDHQTPPFDRQQKEEAWNYALGMIKIDGLEPSEEFKNKTLEEYWREFQRINKNARIARVIESVYDSAISFYKAHGYVFESDLPEIPTKLRRIFKDDKQVYNDFFKECEGKDLVGVAEVYAKFVKSGRIERARSMKPIYNHFVSSDDSQYMTFTRYAK